MSDKEKGLDDVRKDYQRHVLLESEAKSNPFDQFAVWLEDAKKVDPEDYNAMSLTTVGKQGYPHARIVLLRSADRHGLIFYTNYNSGKGHELEHNPKVCLNFFWKELERQVRVYGEVRKLEASESDSYFAKRPRESQIGAWASPQSETIQSREELEKMVAEITIKYEGKNIPRPSFWGGYRIVPHHFEFWQGRANRLHDRLIYKFDSDFQWFRSRLAP